MNYKIDKKTHFIEIMTEGLTHEYHNQLFKFLIQLNFSRTPHEIFSHSVFSYISGTYHILVYILNESDVKEWNDNYEKIKRIYDNFYDISQKKADDDYIKEETERENQEKLMGMLK
jgi:hypothetical protein